MPWPFRFGALASRGAREGPEAPARRQLPASQMNGKAWLHHSSFHVPLP
jgi:hypothetical protein